MVTLPTQPKPTFLTMGPLGKLEVTEIAVCSLYGHAELVEASHEMDWHPMKWTSIPWIVLLAVGPLGMLEVTCALCRWISRQKDCMHRSS